MKTIYLSATNKRITIKNYIASIKLAIENQDKVFSHSLNTWWPSTGEDIRKEFLKSVHDRINKNDNRVDFRKFNSDYQINLKRDSRLIRDKLIYNVSIYQFNTKEIKNKFNHLLSSYNDF